MKRIALFISMFLLLTTFANAQFKLHVGLKGGLNFAGIDGHSKVTQDYGRRAGFHFGAFASLKIWKVAIQPEVVFSRQGQSFSYNTQQNYSTKLDYINVPIMIKVYLVGGFNLQAGPQFGFLVSAKGDVINSSGPAVSTNQDIKNFVNATDLSLGFGFGWDLPRGVNIGARYNLGLSDINKNTGQPTLTKVTSMGNVEAGNQVLQISIGYRLLKIGK